MKKIMDYISSSRDKNLRRLALGSAIVVFLAGGFSVFVPQADATVGGPTCTVDDSGGADYLTIQAAVDVAGCTTITVAAGTYDQVDIPTGRTGLVLAGHSSADTNITVANGTFGIKVASASVNISGFHITATAPDYATSCAPNCGIWFAASGTSGSHTVVEGNKIEGFYNALGSSGGVQYWDIQNNEFNNNRTGVFFNTSNSMLVDHNIFSNYFAGVGGTEGTSDNTITGNLFLGNTGGLDADLSGFSAFVEAIGMTDDVEDMTITNNLFSGATNIYGIQVYDNGGSGTVDAVIRHNSITDTDTFGLNNNTTSAVTAEHNWWGSATGPTHASNPGGTGDEVSDNVDFTPWQEGTVHLAGGGNYDTIQAAVTAASAGDTINVEAGIYNESVTIPAGKNGLSLVGHSSDDTIIAVGDSTFGIKVQSASVNISGFHIRKNVNPTYGDSCADNCGIFFAGSGTSSAHTLVKDNFIEGFYNALGSSGGVEYWDIRNNEFDNNRTGVFFNTSNNMSVSNNTFTNYFAGTGGTESTSNITLFGNNFSGNDGGLDSSLSGFIGSNEAIGMTDDVVDMYIFSNIISGTNAFGIQVYDNAGIPDPVDVNIQNNSISGTSDHGLKNNAGNDVTAENNWWGAASGPDGSGPGTGDNVSADVDFTPFLSADITSLTFSDDASLILTTPAITITLLSGSMANSMFIGEGSVELTIEHGDTFEATSADRDLNVTGDNTADVFHSCGSGVATITIVGGTDEDEILVVTPDSAPCSSGNSGSGGGGGSNNDDEDTPTLPTPTEPPSIPVPLPGQPHGPGSVVKTPDGTVWFITLAGTRRAFTSGGAFLSYGFLNWGLVVDANAEDLALPTGSFITPQDGKVVCSDRTDSYAVKGTCYLMTMGHRAAFTSAAVFTGQGFKFSRALTGDVSFMVVDANISSATAVHRAGVLVNNSGTIQLVGSSSLMGVPSESVFTSWGYSYLDTVLANAADKAMSQSGIMQYRVNGQLSPQ